MVLTLFQLLLLMLRWMLMYQRLKKLPSPWLLIKRGAREKPKLLLLLFVVATTCQNGTHSLLTSAKLLVSYLVVGITRELDKEPSLYYPLYIYMAPGLCYNNIYPALKFMLLPHAHYSSTMLPTCALISYS